MLLFQLQRDNIWKNSNCKPTHVEEECCCSCGSHEDIYGRKGTAPVILNLDTRWRWMISFTLRPLISDERASGTPTIGSKHREENSIFTNILEAGAKRSNEIWIRADCTQLASYDNQTIVWRWEEMWAIRKPVPTSVALTVSSRIVTDFSCQSLCASPLI